MSQCFIKSDSRYLYEYIILQIKKQAKTDFASSMKKITGRNFIYIEYFRKAAGILLLGV
jgi:hypothetical protein